MPAAERRSPGRLLRRREAWLVLGALVVAQWAVLAAVASSVAHDGWLFYDGGDATWYYTSAWVLGEGHVPQTLIGYGYSLLLAPLTWVAGPNRLDGLPLVVGFNALVLAPVALAAVYGVARTLAGRSYAYAVAGLWVVVPVLTVPYLYDGLRPIYLDVVLPATVGLTGNGDYPTMVFMLVSAYFLLRTILLGRNLDAFAAGLAAGFAVAVKPASALFLPAVVVGLVAARRWRGALVTAAGLAPALVGLVLWKYRGLGYLPAFQDAPTALAAARSEVVVAAGGLGKYFDPDWSQLQRNFDALRELTVSRALIGWAVVAGLAGVARRSVPFAALLGTWLAAFVVVKGSREGFSVGSGSFLTHSIGAFPALFLLVAAIPLLVPVAGRRLVDRGRAGVRVLGLRSAAVAAGAIGATSALFLVLVVVLPPLTEPRAATLPRVSQYVPAGTFPLRARLLADGRVLLEWPSQRAGRARASYGVYRVPDEDGVRCVQRRHAAAECVFFSDWEAMLTFPVVGLEATRYVDEPPPGRWVYRVGTRVAPFGPSRSGDLVVISTPVVVDVDR